MHQVTNTIQPLAELPGAQDHNCRGRTGRNGGGAGLGIVAILYPAVLDCGSDMDKGSWCDGWTVLVDARIGSVELVGVVNTSPRSPTKNSRGPWSVVARPVQLSIPTPRRPWSCHRRSIRGPPATCSS